MNLDGSGLDLADLTYAFGPIDLRGIDIGRPGEAPESATTRQVGSRLPSTSLSTTNSATFFSSTARTRVAGQKIQAGSRLVESHRRARLGNDIGGGL